MAKIKRDVTLLSQQKLGITVTITLEGGSGYIYTYIMHNASTQSKKVNAYILRAWLKI